ncbi:glutathione S-transferase family protein [Phenylobacterium aquaticum]|uniref:glutathione S-transferase family protein n=1 Tax=Phenylobacterium aquaticum TaxID=1763816 RepID=UPI0026F35143|nr:glutathione S-transferase family protein [Phenylobacterium aquaticum]
MELVIGTKAWSTWSLRPWLALKKTGAPFTETLISLRQENDMTREAILPHSPSGLVPCLKTDGLVLVDSLAICEFLNEAYPDARLWPTDPAARALGRAAAAEMHSGFVALRSECPMALEIAPRPLELSAAAGRNVARIAQIWSELLARFGGPFLLGEWSIADAFYTPVATRLRTYQIDLAAYGGSAAATAYCGALLETPEFLAWEAAARAEA